MLTDRQIELFKLSAAGSWTVTSLTSLTPRCGAKGQFRVNLCQKTRSASAGLPL